MAGREEVPSSEDEWEQHRPGRPTQQPAVPTRSQSHGWPLSFLGSRNLSRAPSEADSSEDGGEWGRPGRPRSYNESVTDSEDTNSADVDLTLSKGPTKGAAFLGPFAAVAVGGVMAYFPPPGLGMPARHLLAVTLWMIIWWMTEAVPMGVTSLLPILLFPPLGILKDTEVAASYSHPVSWMFFGGFQLAFAIEKAGLHVRFAFLVLRAVGTRPACIMLGVMYACALLSMFLSNTSTTIMLLPMSEALAAAVEAGGAAPHPFGKALLLGLAYSASVGGLGSLIGTPPNGVLAEQASLFGQTLSFKCWLGFAAPLSLIMVLIIWLFLVTRYRIQWADLSPEHEARTALQKNPRPMSQAERRVAAVFALTVLAWIVRKPVAEALHLQKGMLEDNTISIAVVVVLFLVPARGCDGEGVRRLLDWPTLLRTPWHILFLFGAGFSLASGFRQTGLSNWIGDGLVGLKFLPSYLMVLITVLLVTFLTEVTSNTATASVLLPVIGELALSLDMSPALLMVPATLAASCAFMLPVATPPNAIVCATHRIKMPDMASTGFLLNVASALLITVWMLTWGRLFFTV